MGDCNTKSNSAKLEKNISKSHESTKDFMYPRKPKQNHTGAKIRHKDKALQDVGTGAFPR